MKKKSQLIILNEAALVFGSPLLMRFVSWFFFSSGFYSFVCWEISFFGYCLPVFKIRSFWCNLIRLLLLLLFILLIILFLNIVFFFFFLIFYVTFLQSIHSRKICTLPPFGVSYLLLLLLFFFTIIKTCTRIMGYSNVNRHPPRKRKRKNKKKR